MQLLDPITLWSDVTSGNEVEPTLQIYVFIVLLKKYVGKKRKKRCCKSVEKSNFKFSLLLFIPTFCSFGELKKSLCSTTLKDKIISEAVKKHRTV